MNRVNSTKMIIFICYASACVAILCCSIFIYLTNSIFSSGKKTADFNISTSIPPNFVVDSKFDSIINKPQSTADYSWIFAFISFLESKYRFQSILNREKKAISFSEQAVKSSLSDLCKNISNADNLCSSNLLTKFGNAVKFHEIMKKHKELEDVFLPSSVCKNDENSFSCPDLKKYALKSSIHFQTEIKGQAHTSDEIKDLLYKSQSPILLSMPEATIKYYMPCDDKVDQLEKTECIQKNILCPKQNFFNSDSQNCEIIKIPSYNSLGEYLLPQRQADLTPGEIVNFIIIGYSDSYSGIKGRATDDSLKHGVGGFIVKKIHSSNYGFEINHYLGLLGNYESLASCPNIQFPGFWRAPKIDCIRANKSFEKCPSNEKNILESQKKIHFLKCINKTYCNPLNNYTLQQLPLRTPNSHIKYTNSGMAVTPMFEKTQNGEIKEILFDSLPFHMIHLAFQVDPESNKKVNSMSCGYWFIPYELIDLLNSKSAGLLGGSDVIAMDLEVKFDKSAFLSNIQNKTTKTLYEKSTFEPPVRHESTID